MNTTRIQKRLAGLASALLLPVMTLAAPAIAGAKTVDDLPVVQLRNTDDAIPALTVFVPGELLGVTAISPYGDENIVCEYNLPEFEKATCWQKTPEGQWVSMMSVELPTGSVEFFPAYQDPELQAEFEDFFGRPFPEELLDDTLDNGPTVVDSEDTLEPEQTQRITREIAEELANDPTDQPNYH